MNCSPPGSSVQGETGESWDSPDKHTGVDCHALLQGIFPIQGWNPGLPHCRQILYHLSQGSPGILKWVAMPSFRRSSRPRDQTPVCHVYLHWPMGLLLLAPPGKPLISYTPVKNKKLKNTQKKFKKYTSRKANELILSQISKYIHKWMKTDHRAEKEFV